MTSGMTAGNVAVVVAVASNGTCTSVTSTPSNTWQPWVFQSLSGSERITNFVARNVASGTNSLVVTCPGASSFVSAMVYELANVTAADVAGSIKGSGGTPSVSTIQPVGTSTEEVIASFYDNNNFVTWAAGIGYTIQAQVNQSGSQFLGVSEDNNTKTGLSGTQTATITGVGSDTWVGTVLTFASTPTPDAADIYITFEGLSNTVKPTLAQLTASAYGVPLTWVAPSSTVFTGATGSQGTTTPAPHQVGATSFTGSGSLGLAYATGTVANDLTASFSIDPSDVSWIGQFKTSIPQNESASNAYTLTRLDNTSGDPQLDYIAPQIQATGSSLILALECPNADGSGTIAISTNTLYYIFVKASHGGGVDNMRVYDSSGVEITTPASGTVAPMTCTSKSGTTGWHTMEFGVNGLESETAGSVISWDNIRVSLQGTALTP